MISFLLAAVVAVSPATPNPIAQHIAEVQRAIDAGNAEYIATWQHGDAKAFAALFAANADSIGDDGTVYRGRATIEAQRAKSMAKADLVRGTIKTTDLVVDGDTAYEMGTYLFTLRPKGGSATDYRGRYLTIWMRQPDGTWKIATDAGLPERPCDKLG